MILNIEHVPHHIFAMLQICIPFNLTYNYHPMISIYGNSILWYLNCFNVVSFYVAEKYFVINTTFPQLYKISIFGNVQWVFLGKHQSLCLLISTKVLGYHILGLNRMILSTMGNIITYICTKEILRIQG